MRTDVGNIELTCFATQVPITAGQKIHQIFQVLDFIVSSDKFKYLVSFGLLFQSLREIDLETYFSQIGGSLESLLVKVDATHQPQHVS